MFHQKLNDKSGMALLVVLVIALVSTILASSYMGSVISESRHSVWQKNRAQSLFIAESGVQAALYYLNSPADKTQWEGEEHIEFPLLEGDVGNGAYAAQLYDSTEKPFIPSGAFFVESKGTIPRPNSEDVERRVSCILIKLDSVPVGAALSIYDWGDLTPELMQFQSARWIVDGKDHNEDGSLIKDDSLINPLSINNGMPGIAVANDTDNLPLQLVSSENQIDSIVQVMGMRDMGRFEGTEAVGVEEVTGVDAIIEDLDLPKDLDAYANYFRKIGNDISGEPKFIPEEIMGTEDQLTILYANLSQGDKKIAAQTRGWGILVLEGNGVFEMAGGSWWNGLVICAGKAQIAMKGGGNTPAHINGALMLADGTVEMNGTADVTYCSGIISRINAFLLLFQVYAWCDGWGEPLGSDTYDPVTDKGFQLPSSY